MLASIHGQMEQAVPEHGDEDVIATYWARVPRTAQEAGTAPVEAIGIG
jgi:hypothetical protein